MGGPPSSLESHCWEVWGFCPRVLFHSCLRGAPPKQPLTLKWLLNKKSCHRFFTSPWTYIYNIFYINLKKKKGFHWLLKTVHHPSNSGTVHRSVPLHWRNSTAQQPESPEKAPEPWSGADHVHTSAFGTLIRLPGRSWGWGWWSCERSGCCPPHTHPPES